MAKQKQLQRKNPLPKQFKHWCRKAGMKFHGRGHWDAYYPFSRYNNFRVDCNNCFDIGTFHLDFDRWANSCFHTVPMEEINTEEKFLDWVRTMSFASKHAYETEQLNK